MNDISKKETNGFNVIKAILLVIGLPFAFVGVLTLYIYTNFSYDHLELVTEESTVVQDDRAIRVEYLGEPANIVPVDYEQIPRQCINALVAAEDRSFYSNPGYDVSGLLRGIYDEFANLNYGGSSITHQLIKIGTAKYFNRTLYDKYFEVVAGVKMNNEISKEQIMEMYMNNVYLGNFNYGIGAAALNYFGKDVNELNLAECSYLMGLPQQPSIFQPFADLESGKRRQFLVLSFMLQQNMISAESFKSAVTQELVFVEEDILLSNID